ncbi:MAG: 50S ribosomal protein L11 methyltransferase [Nitrospirae bacterium]|nr:50S ribosomal protein L11 methyltransferase [Nitrospirota bacterium]
MKEKEYIEVSLEVAPQLQESLSSFFIEIGAGGAWIDGAKVKAFFNPADCAGEEIEKRMVPFFDRFREEGVEVPSKSFHIQKNIQEDWNGEWKKFFKPVSVTPALTVAPPWQTVSRKNKGERDIIIDPGLGFGTGTHPTTFNCLVFLERFMLAHPDPPSLKVLDLGSGSGILAIGASLFGAGYIVAAEIDGDAVESMRNNFILNQVQDKIRIRLGSIFQADRRSYHLILANLTAEDLIRSGRELQGALLPGGTLILSGILVEKKEEVEKTFGLLKLEKADEKIDGNWVTQVWEKGCN